MNESQPDIYPDTGIELSSYYDGTPKWGTNDPLAAHLQLDHWIPPKDDIGILGIQNVV